MEKITYLPVWPFQLQIKDADLVIFAESHFDQDDNGKKNFVGVCLSE